MRGEWFPEDPDAEWQRFYEDALAELNGEPPPKRPWAGGDDGGYRPNAEPPAHPNVSRAEAAYDGPGIWMPHLQTQIRRLLKEVT